MKILHDLKDESGERLLVFHCPGCGYDHCFRVERERGDVSSPVWGWNEDFDKPTFTPSLLVNGDYPESRCHLFLTDGRIQYLGDCHHEYRGCTVEMVEVDW